VGIRGHNHLLDELKTHSVLGKLLISVIPSNEAVSYAHHNHLSIFNYDPKAPASKAYAQLVGTLVRRMAKLAGQKPANYDQLLPSEKQLEERGIRFAGQRSMSIDEASRILIPKKYMEGHAEALMQLFDAPDRMERELRGDGKLIVYNPALSLIGATTPAMLARYLTDAEWGSGLMARILLLTPLEKDVPYVVSDPSPELVQVMEGLKARLLRIHNAFPAPPESEALYSAEESLHLPAVEARLEPEVMARFNAYSEAMHELTDTRRGLDERLRGNYGRFPVLTMKMALILTVMDWVESGAKGVPRISLAHWSRAQLLAAVEMPSHQLKYKHGFNIVHNHVDFRTVVLVKNGTRVARNPCSENPASVQHFLIHTDTMQPFIVDERQKPVKYDSCALFVACFQLVPDGYLYIRCLRSWHIACTAAPVFINQIDATLSAENTFTGCACYSNCFDELARFWKCFFLDVIDSLKFTAQALQQRRIHRCSHRPNVILDTDRHVNCFRNRLIVIITTCCVGMHDMGRHRHDAVGPYILRELAQGDGWQRVSGSGGSYDRNLTRCLGDNNINPAFAFVVGEQRKFAGIGWANQTLGAGFDAKSHLLSQANFVQFVAFGKGRNNDNENTAPGFSHDAPSTLSSIIRATLGSCNGTGLPALSKCSRRIG
jgi:hypothetical protein